MTQPLLAPPLLAAVPAHGGFDVFGAFLESGPMAKIVFAVLLAFSLGSWAVMISKFFLLRKAQQQSETFLETFYRSRQFGEIRPVAERLIASPLASLFKVGHDEIKLQMKMLSAEAQEARSDRPRYRIQSVNAVERKLRQAKNVESKILAKNTSLLATTAAATPFIGLFGTVWGIMIAFGDIGATGSTSIATVAPGIAEALINTAAGLGAAIPALVGNNYLASKLRDVRGQMEEFILEFVNLAERNFT
ncbi:MAG: MotA/TolQ/ExbB proton channel family protein [Acidobacteriota bacterium]